jgi:hypothetical protein
MNTSALKPAERSGSSSHAGRTCCVMAVTALAPPVLKNPGDTFTGAAAPVLAVDGQYTAGLPHGDGVTVPAGQKCPPGQGPSQEAKAERGPSAKRPGEGVGQGASQVQN